MDGKDTTRREVCLILLNRRQAADGGARQATDIRSALSALSARDIHLPAFLLRSAQARLDDPSASLSELADRLGLANRRVIKAQLQRLARMAREAERPRGKD